MKKFVTVALMLFVVGTTCYSDTPKLNENNVDSVIRLLTIQEKALLIVGRNDYTFGGYDNPDEFVRFINPSVSGYTQGVQRLGIPPTALADGPAGVVVVDRPDNKKHYYATGFPTGSLLASSWNQQLVEEVGKVMGKEALEYGVDVILAPGMNIMRSPLCGRNYEYFSEDPIVSGKIASAFTKGVQSNGVGVSLKHYAVNSQETNRTDIDEVVAQRPLREIYLKGFEIAVKEASPWTVMASYNRLNGPLTQENPELLTTVLRDEWGFDGMVMTDWIQIRDTEKQIKAGIDNLQPGYQNQYEDILALIDSGKLTEADLDRAVGNMLRYVLKTLHYRNYPSCDSIDVRAGAEMARTAASEGMVLLKNSENTLPLSPEVKNIALFGLHSFDFLSGGTGSGNVVKPYVVNLEEGLKNAGYSIDENMNRMYQAYKSFVKAKNKCDRDPKERWYQEPPTSELGLSNTCINNQADNADLAIITIGRQAGEGRDRQIDGDFNLSAEEKALIDDVCDAFHAHNKKVIVILNIGSAIEIASWRGRPDAILISWQPGQEGGNAVADVLTGKVNPSGKLAMTMPIAYSDIPSSRNFPLHGSDDYTHRNSPRRNVDYTLHSEGLDIGYRYFCSANKEVAYPFGYGLSYTEFEYSKPIVKPVYGGLEATITVRNTGISAGKESVQLYITAPNGDIYKPVIELKGFAKTNLLQPGQSENLTIYVSDYDLASFHEDTQSWIADAGIYEVKFGASSLDIRNSAKYRLKQSKVWKVNNVLRPNREL